MTIEEYFLSIDDTYVSKVVNDFEAICALVIKLIMLEPGTIQIMPEMGVGLVSHYRYLNEESIPQIQSAIIQQINTYLPTEISYKISVNLDSKLVNNMLTININITNTQTGEYTSIPVNNLISLSDL